MFKPEHLYKPPNVLRILETKQRLTNYHPSL